MISADAVPKWRVVSNTKVFSPHPNIFGIIIKWAVDDALRVVVEPENFGISYGSFEAVFVDIYIGEKYPDLGSSGNFISAVKKMLMPGGLVIFNRMYHSTHQDDVNIFIDYVSNFFKEVKCLVVAGHTNSDNILIYGRV